VALPASLETTDQPRSLPDEITASFLAALDGDGLISSATAQTIRELLGTKSMTRENLFAAVTAGLAPKIPAQEEP
jgi:hypothetical protein